MVVTGWIESPLVAEVRGKKKKAKVAELDFSMETSDSEVDK